MHNRWPDPSAYKVSPEEHPNTLRLSPSYFNLTGPDSRTGTPQTFVGRRQEHIEFSYEVDLDFKSDTDGAEAGITVFLNQGQHFDLGVVSFTSASAKAAGHTGVLEGGNAVSQYVRLRTITSTSTHEGSVDPISRPGIVALPKNVIGPVKLRVDGINRTTYEFKFTVHGSEWFTVGYGNSSQVSGGFVGTLGQFTQHAMKYLLTHCATGTILGMFATGNGKNASDLAYFSSLSYVGNNKVY